LRTSLDEEATARFVVTKEASVTRASHPVCDLPLLPAISPRGRIRSPPTRSGTTLVVIAEEMLWQ
jgi:hypothetical protein